MATDHFMRREQVATSAEQVTADAEGLAPRVIFFVPKVSGDLALRARRDSVGAASGANYVTMQVTAGEPYPVDVEGVDITNSVASQEVTLFRLV